MAKKLTKIIFNFYKTAQTILKKCWSEITYRLTYNMVQTASFSKVLLEFFMYKMINLLLSHIGYCTV